MTEIKNILIIGGIGVGKTTLANVISGTEVFKEESSSSIETWRAKDKEFEVKEEKKATRYRVIDTVGLGDTKLTKEELLEKFEEEVGSYIDEGINQILFVTDGRFSKEVFEEYLLINEFLFEKKAFDYTTMVWTKLEDEKKCEENTNELVKFFVGKKEEVYEEFNKKVLKEGKIVYVNNPPIDVKNKRKLDFNKKHRVASQEKLLNCLKDFISEKSYQPETRKWLDKNYPLKSEREKISILGISKRNLKGRLSLKGFTNLKRLNCSDNQLTNLDLSDCPSLIELKCNDNQFTNLNFLKSVSNLEKLEIQNNKNLSLQSLKTLENLNKLEEINIENTNLSEGWECLLKNCKRLYCDSKEITKELDKKNCSDNDKDGEKYYNLDKWRETDKQNKLTASVIPLERLYVIRSNIKSFVDKWGKESKDDWYDKSKQLFNKWVMRKEENANNLIELNRLKHPNEFSKSRWLTTGAQWTNRATSVAGGSLLLIGARDKEDNNNIYTQTGGIIAIASPFVEIVTSQINDKIYEAREKKWEEFVEDTKNLLDNYHELLGILEKIEISELGIINRTLNDLRNKTKSFLEKYDEDKNGVIDISELTEKRNEFGTDLSKEKQWAGGSQLGRIVQVMKRLEKNIINYRQTKTSGEISLDDRKQELAWSIIDWLEEYSSPEFDAENKGKKDNHWQGKSTWKEYLEEITEEDAKMQENLLYPLAELIIKELKDTKVEELLKNYEENKQDLEAKFVKKVKDLCDVCQELENEELNKAIIPLKNKVNDFVEYLEKCNTNGSREEIKEKRNKLEKIVEVIKSLEEQVKICHESLTNKEKKVDSLENQLTETGQEEEIKEDIQQATIEIPIDK